ncbi:MAG TPA: MFS transporter [Mycobacteriales bacterium]|nr:MFS transporter [Mycobacteriales bacterium]
MTDVFRSLRVRNYRLFATGQLISLIGTWMQVVGQDWLVLKLGGGGVELGITTALQFAPTLFLGLWAGVIADRFPKRRLLIAVQAFMGVCALALAVLTATGVIRLWMVLVLALLLGLGTVVDIPTRQAFVSELVPPAEVPNAVALNSATFNTGRIVGPALAAVLITRYGVTPVFFVNAASFAGVLVGLARMRERDMQPHRATPRAKGQVREAIRFVATHHDLLLVVVLTGVVATFGFNFRITLALIGRGDADGGATTYGVLSSILAFGSLVGALAAAKVRRPRQSMLVGSAVGFGLLLMVTAAMPTRVLFALMLVPTGAAIILFTSTANATVQLGTPAALRGRVMSVYILVFVGVAAFGAPLMGWVAELSGPRGAMAVGGLVSALGGLAAGVLLLRQSGVTTLRDLRGLRAVRRTTLRPGAPVDVTR